MCWWRQSAREWNADAKTEWRVFRNLGSFQKFHDRTLKIGSQMDQFHLSMFTFLFQMWDMHLYYWCWLRCFGFVLMRCFLNVLNTSWKIGTEVFRSIKWFKKYKFDRDWTINIFYSFIYYNVFYCTGFICCRSKLMNYWRAECCAHLNSSLNYYSRNSNTILKIQLT